jgi:hypothetical protein
MKWDFFLNQISKYHRERMDWERVSREGIGWKRMCREMISLEKISREIIERGNREWNDKMEREWVE